MKSVLILVAFMVLSFYSKAQVEREEVPPPVGPQIQINNDLILGKVLDSKTGRPLESVTVQLYAFQSDSNTAIRDTLVGGMFTRANGDFSFSKLPPADSFRVVISGIGYKEFSRTVIPIRADNSSAITELGNITIEQVSQVMDNVVITTQRPALTMGIDRKIFSVEQSLISTGGTALDVMRNIPSVSVDVEGNVLLRNAQPQIFVDGRPTILTLDQIPAEQVERVELITNPSARFDASSSTGIINVVMKRNRRIGLNGVATIGGGHPSSMNGNLTINIRQGKLNFFTSAGYNKSGGRSTGEAFRQNKSNGSIENYFNQFSKGESNRVFRSLRFGLDFFASNRTTISATQNIVAGRFKNEEEQQQQYLNGSEVLERNGYRSYNSENSFDRYNSQLNFIHRFPEQGKEISANVNYNYGDGTESSHILNSFTFPNGTPFSDPARVRNAGRNNNDQYTFQIDFVDPSGEDSKLEAGVRSYINKQRSLFSSFSITNGSEVLLPLGNNYSYTEKVNAAYISYSNKLKKFSYQAGLRAEVSSFDGLLIDSAKSFGYDYPKDAGRFFDALFPSLFLTKEVGDNVELQVNYTRRIRRPNFWQLNPFIDINDPVNLRQGNPLLQPEFVNSFEFNFSQNYNKGNFLAEIYYRNNMRDITRYSDTISSALYQQLNNAAIDPNAILNTFINARSTNTLGADFTLQHKFTDKFEVTPAIELAYRKVNADVGDVELSNSGFTWEAQVTTNFKFANEKGILKDLGLQLMGEYESEDVNAQGRSLPEYRVDFGLRKEFLKDRKASFSFNINDIFNTHRFGNILDTETFYQESYRRRNVRSFRLSLTYKFGKDEFNLFRREERNDNNDE